MDKRMRNLFALLRKPLTWVFALSLVLQLFPLQGMAYAVEEAQQALGVQEQIVSDAPAPVEEVPAPAPQPQETTPEPAPEPEPEPEPVAPAEQAEPVAEPAAEAEPEQATEPEAEVDSEAAEAEDPEAQAEVEGSPEEEADAEKDVAYDKKSLSGNIGSTKVVVDAPDGALPNGVELRLKDVTSQSLLDRVDAVTDYEVAAIQAIDVSFWFEGKEIEPKAPVSVTFRNTSVDTANTDVFHVADSGAIEAVPASDVNVATSSTVSFDADQFSVYVVVEAVVPRLTVKFMNGSTEVATMYVKGDDTSAEVDDIVYDPGAGTIPSGQVFKGWTTDPEYTAESKLMTIAQVREDAMTRADALTNEDGEVTYYAAMFKQYTVTYVDGAGITVGTEVAETPARLTEATYTVNMGYVTDDTHNFEGWTPVDGQSNIIGYPNNAETETIDESTIYYYANGTTLTLTGSVKFSVDAPAGYWLVFDENGKGATYNAPRFIKAGDFTSSEGMLDMVRNGYTFGGWYTDAACTAGNEFTFGGQISETTTIYAKWTAITSAQYTVLIWKQNLAGDGYDFVEAVHPNGTVGATPNVVTTTGNNAGRVTGATYAGETGFHFKETDQASKTIAPEGNTVVNVYWDRNEYTLTFQVNGAYEVATDNSGTQYRKDGDQYQQIYYNNGTWYTNRSWSGGWSGHWVYSGVYTGTRYKYNSGWTTVKTITALYGQSIGDNFPIEGSNGVTYDDGQRWMPQNSSTYNNVLIYIDIMPAENVTFHLNTADHTTKYINYYVEALPGQTPDTTYSGKNFVLHKNMSANYGYFTEAEDYLNFVGFTKFGYTPSNAWGSGGASTVNCYYIRNHYAINFMDGAYVDGNGNPISETSRGQLSEIEDIAYGSDLTSYNKGGVNYYEPTAPSGYVFEGWYIDSACTHAYDFTTMPEGGVTVYAKWRQIQYRVFLHPNAGTDSTLTWGSDNQGMSFRVSYGGKISVPTGQRTGYDFFGWYTDEACTQAFTANAQIRGGSSYDKNTHMTDPMDKWGNGATTNADVDRFWITEEFNLYAKWSAIIVGADGIGIFYDPNGGSNAPSDTALYKDNSSVTAGAAPTAPAGQVFDHWVLQTWNGSAYVDLPGSEIPAGGTFTVLKSYARIQDAATHADVAAADVVETGTYTYTVQLRAEYRDVDEETLTHIDFYGNYGSENDGKGTLYKSYTGIKINEAVDIIAAPTRAGYTFKGWTKTKGGTTANFLIWDGTNYTDTRGDVATQVAADEKQPYDDLYAVWEENDVTINYAVASDSTSFEGVSVSPTTETIKSSSGTAAGSTASCSTSTYVIDYWTMDDGTDHVGNAATFVPQKNADGAYEEHTYFAHFKLNTATVTVHHYLKGTTTKVADDVTATATIGTEYTAEAATTFYAEYQDCTFNSYDPTQTITVEVEGNVITIYYTLPLTITAKDQTYTYNGSAQGPAGTYTEGFDDYVTVEGLLEGDALTSVMLSGSQTNAGTYEDEIVPSEAAVGEAGYYVISYVEGKLTITPKAVTVKANDASKVYDNDPANPATYTATVTGLVGSDTVTYTVAREAGEDVGEYTITPSGETTQGNYTVTYETGTFEITPKAVTVKADDASKVYDNNPANPATYTATVTGLVGSDTVTYTVAREAGEDVGEYTITPSGETTQGNYTVTYETGTFKITKASATVTITGKSNTAPYDGAEHTVTGYDAESSNALYDVSEGNSNFTFSGSATANRTNVVEGMDTDGQTDMGLVASQFANNNENFDVTFVIGSDGYQKITPIDVTVTVAGANNTTTYDGEEHTVTGYTATASTELYDVTKDFTFSGTATASRKDVGTTNMGLAASQFENTNTNFGTVTFDVTDGYQTINPVDKVTVTITGHKNTTDYDGEEHSVSGYDVQISDPLYTEDDFTFSGTAEAKRTDAGTTNMGLAPEQFTNTNGSFANVEFVVVDGYQTVSPINVTVTIVGNNNTTDYDGDEHTVSGYTATASTTLYDVAKDFTFSGTASAARTDAGTTNMDLAAEQFTNTNTNFGTVTFDVTDGYQTISPINVTVTITGATNTTDYDGAEHSVSGYDVSISNPLYKEADFTFSGTAEAKRTDAGQTNMGLSASQFTNTNTNFATVTFTVNDGYQKIDPIDVTVTVVGANNTATYDGEAHTVSGYTATASTTLYDVTKDFTFSGDDTASRVTAGTTNMGLAAEQFENTNTNFGTVTFNVTDGYQTIDPLAVIVTITGHNSTVVYDGFEHTVTGYEAAANSNLYLVGEYMTFTGTAEAKRTEVGTTNMGLEASQFANNGNAAQCANFTVTFDVTDGYQTITELTDKVTVTITENSGSEKYDGSEKTVTGYTVSIDNELYTEDDFTFSGNATVKGTDAGSYPMELTAADFTNTNTNFSNVEFVIVDGTLEVTKRTVTLTSATDSKVYDGTALTNGTVTVGGDGFAAGEGATYDVTGTITNFGEVVNAFTYTLNEGTKAANYTITTVEGKLSITPVTDEVIVTIKGNKDSKVYNGSEQNVTGYTVSIDNELYTEAMFSFSGDDAAKGTNVGTYPMGLDASQFTNNSSNFTNVTFNVTDGELKITQLPVTVTITGNTGSKVYNGSEQQVEGYEVSISNSLYTEAMFSFSGDKTAKGTDVGTYPMGLATSQFTNANDNFDVTFTVIDGKLEITPVTEEVIVTITGKTATNAYDGNEHTVTGYDATSSNTLYDATTDNFTFSGNDTASRTNVVEGTDVDGKTNMGLAADQFTNTNKNFSNVTFNVTDGYQEITPIDVTVTITGHHDSVTYDGNEHTVSGYDVEISNPLYKENDFTFTGEATASRTENGKTAMGLAAEQFENTNTNFGTVTFNVTDGYMEIVPVDEVVVTITGHNNTTDYDGTEHSVSGYDVEISNQLYTEADFTFSGTASAARTDAGTTNMGLTAEQFANTNGNFAKVTFNVTDGYQTVNPINVTVTITGNTGSKVYNGSEQSVTGYTVETSNPLYKEADFTFSGTASAARTDAGTTNMGLTAEQFANTNGNFATVSFNVTDGSLTITQREVTVSVEDKTVEYNGSEQYGNTEYTFSNVVSGQTATITYTPSKGTLVDTYDNGVYADDFKVTDASGTDVTGNYSLGTQTAGKLTISNRTDKYEIELTPNGDEAKYDGIEHTVSGFETLEFTVDGNTYTVSGATASATGTDTGTYPVTVDLTSAVVKDAAGNDVTAQFTVTSGNADLTITKRSVTLTSASAEKEYDGTPLTRNAQADVTVTGDGFVEGEGATYDITGTQTTVGESPNAFTYTLNEGTKADNYTITTVPGTLKVTELTDKVTVTIAEHSDTVTYDGEEHTVTGYDVTSIQINGADTTLYTVADFGFDGDATVKGTEAGTYDMELTADDFTNTNTYFSNVEFVIVDGTLVIDPVSAKVTVTITENSGSEKYDGSEKTVTGYTVSIDNELYTEDDFTFSGNATVKGTDAGSYPMELKAADFTNTNTNFSNVEFVIVDGTLEIAKRTVTLTSATDEKYYDGFELTNDEVTVGGDGFAAGEGATYEVTGSQLVPGASENEFTYTLNDGTKAANYTITTVEGTLTVKSRTNPDDPDAPGAFKIQVTSNSDTQKYDGSAKSVSGFEKLDFDVAGESGIFKVTVSGLEASGSGTDAGTYSDAITGIAVVKDVQGNDVTSEFEVAQKEGTLEITKRSVTLTSATDSKEYDGSPLTNDEVTVSGDGFAAGEGATYDVTGSQKLVGTSPNTFTYTLNNGTKAGNYEIETVNGTLTVTNREAKYQITLVANSSTGNTYDGKVHSATGVVTDKFTFDGVEYTVSGFTTEDPTKTNAGTYTNNITAANGYIVTDPDVNDVSEQFAVTPQNGTLEIAKRSVTLVSGGATKVYDGIPLTNETVTGTDAFVDTEGVKLSDFASQTEAGSIENSFTYKLKDNTLADNYDITTTFGTLTVTKANDPDDPESTRFEGTIEIEGWTYGNAANAPTYEVKGIDGADPSAINEAGATIEYSADSTTWSTTVPTDAGDYTVRATWAETDSWGEITATASFTIAKRVVKLSSETAEKVYDGNALTRPDVKVEGDGFVEGEATAAATGTITDVGSVTNTIVVTEGTGFKADNYTISKDEGTLTITEKSISEPDPDDPDNPKPAATIQVTGPEDTMYNGSEQKQPVEVKDTQTGKTLEEGTDYTLTYSEDTTNAGTVTVTVTGIGNYTGSFDLTYQITKRSVTIASADDEKVYDGTPLTNDGITITGNGFVEGEATASAKGTITNVGEAPNTIVVTPGESFRASNYDITTIPGTLKVTEKDISIPDDPDDPDNPDNPNSPAETISVSGPDDTVYNGQSQQQRPTVVDTQTGATLVEGTDYTLEYSDDTTNVGTVTVTIIGMGNYKGRFKLTYQITPAPLTITTGSATKAYDGTALTSATVTVTGLQGNERLEVVATGSQTAVGSSLNTVRIVWGDRTQNVLTNRVFGAGTAAKSTNYDVTVNLGTLTVTPPAPAVTPTPDGPVPPTPTPTPDTPTPDTPTPEVVPDAPTPAAPAPTNNIPDAPNPLAPELGSWSLFDLICTILTALASVILLALGLGKTKKDAEEDEQVEQAAQTRSAYATADEDEDPEQIEIKRRRMRRMLSLIPGIGEIVLFILTQDLTLPMAIFDRWSLVFFIATVVQAIICVVSRKKEEDPEDDDQDQQPQGTAPVAA